MKTKYQYPDEVSYTHQSSIKQTKPSSSVIGSGSQYVYYYNSPTYSFGQVKSEDSNTISGIGNYM